MIRYLLILFIGCTQFVISQNFSEKALTGRGELKLVGEHYKLQKDVFEAFKKMQNEALNDGVKIQIVSAYRSFDRQKYIWNKKYSKYLNQGLKPLNAIQKIIQYSTIPGTSRHHWGTDIDVIEGGKKNMKSVLLERNFEENGVYSNLKKWMDKNASKFGFYLVYTKDASRKGFKYEPWHYSYKPISKKMLEVFQTINIVNFLKINSVKGNEYISTNLYSKYKKEHILGINSLLLD